jgi:hypothetical protein
MRSRTATTLRLLTLAALALPTGTGLAQAQGSGAAPHGRLLWRFKPTLTSGAEYDDNIYLLSDSKKDNLTSPSANDVVSGRYADMERVGDLITTLHAELEASGRGLGGRALTITPEAEYELYAWNAQRRTGQLGVSVAQALPRGARFRVKADMTPSTFFKNYLANAVDADNSGSITPDERIYAAGSYADREISADFRLRVSKLTKSHPFGAALQLGAGYSGRSYDAPFAMRDVSGPTASVGLMLDLRRDIELDVGYEFASLGATPGRAVMLLDENQFGVDFNGNGSTNDVDARALEMADHSRAEHGLSMSLKAAPAKRLDVRLDYSHRWRRFGSTQPYDVTYNGRRDARDELGAGVGVRLASSLRLNAAFLIQSQSLNRANDPAGLGDVSDYNRHRTSVGLSYVY